MFDAFAEAVLKYEKEDLGELRTYCTDALEVSQEDLINIKDDWNVFDFRHGQHTSGIFPLGGCFSMRGGGLNTIPLANHFH